MRRAAFPKPASCISTAPRPGTELGWCPPLSFDRTVQLTAQWYRGFSAAPGRARQLTIEQIDHYREAIDANS